jgi:hypothetical protein
MNNEEKQTELELFYLKPFLQRMEVEPENIERGEDPPDFYITYRSNRIAIELTEYHSQRKGTSGRAWRAVEQEWHRIRSLFIEERKQYPTLDDVHGFLFFRELEMPPAAKRAQFVTELLNFGISQYKTLKEEESWFDSFPSDYPLLNKYLKKMNLKKVHCYITWDRASAAFVGITEKELKECVLKKLRMSRPQQITENWLLIVSGASMSQQIGLTPYETFNQFAQINNSLEKSYFDKVFFYQYAFNRILCWSHDRQWVEVKPARFARDH